jgi:DNA polymerase III delta prime subunit
MATIYPPSISTETDSPGEIELFKKIKNDPIAHNWIVLHSLDIAKHKQQRSGEADFVIIVPNKGVLCLEVKAAKSIRRKNGLWFIGAKRPEKRGPFRQASLAMHSLQEGLWKKDKSLKRIVFGAAVIFPYLVFNIESSEWHPWQAIDSEDYKNKSIGQLVLDTLEHTRLHIENTPSARWFDPSSNEPSENQVKRIAELLRPNFEFFESPEARAKRRREEIKTYTEEQFDALDAMSSNPRVIFSGPAGTGKSLLAIELARRKTLEGKKVLFLCYNRLLGEWLQDQTASLKPLVKTSTIHSHMLSVAGISLQDNSNSFWKASLPKAAITTLSLDVNKKHLYDLIIVDEAQDILTSNYLAFLNSSLLGGLSSGSLYLFGDFEKQVLYQNDPHKIIKTNLSHFPQFSLRINCRNTPRIAEFVHLLGGLQPRYSRIRRPDNNVEPEIILFSSNSQQKEKLFKTIDNLTKTEKYLGRDIIILSPRSEEHCIARQIGGVVKPIYSLSSDLDIGFCSTFLFKGLEAPIIILTDIDDISTSQAKSLFYTAITRALDKLIVFVNKKTRETLLEIISSTARERSHND